MDRPTSRLASGRDFEASMAPAQVGDRDLAPALDRPDAVEVERVDVGDVGEQALYENWATVRSPRPSMSIAPREAKWLIRWTCWPGHSTLMQKVSASPSRRCERGRTDRAGRREGPRRQARRPQRQHRSAHLRDDVARPADHDGVARPDVLGPHLVLVVQEWPG